MVQRFILYSVIGTAVTAVIAVFTVMLISLVQGGSTTVLPTATAEFVTSWNVLLDRSSSQLDISSDQADLYAGSDGIPVDGSVIDGSVIDGSADLPVIDIASRDDDASASGAPEPLIAGLTRVDSPILPNPTGGGPDDTVVFDAGQAIYDANEWNPPQLVPPISLDPLGRDHFWLMRPIGASGRNRILEYYHYGSDGIDPSQPLRIHHGVDMPNPIGETVRAAGDGTVVWAQDARQDETLIFQSSPTYGNVIVIRHDFSFEGRALYTLYAHLSAALVEEGQQVVMGQPIGLVGESGQVTGPHVHFEVRLGQNRYAATVNPALWITPYVGHGVIVGRLVDSAGNPVEDHTMEIYNASSGRFIMSTGTYIYGNSTYDVNADDNWDENFVFMDVPAGRYDIVTRGIGGLYRVPVEVREGMSSYVEMSINPYREEDVPSPDTARDPSADTAPSDS